jgi:plastocyanin
MRKWIAVVVMLSLPGVAAVSAAAEERTQRGSFVARALPFPVMQDDIYYPQKSSCLGGVEGIHKVSESFHARAPGALQVSLHGLSGDWDLYVLGPRDDQLGASDKAQVLDGAEGDERVNVAVRRHQQLQMVACNWLGEPEVTVRFEFLSDNSTASAPHQHDRKSASKPATRGSTHKVQASGGPVSPLWEWDPSELEISVGDRVVWLNKTGTDHHVTPYGGPWKGIDSMHLPTDGQVDFVFRKPGEYLYRCDFAFAGIEHSFLVGDDCLGMCGRIVVKE